MLQNGCRVFIVFLFASTLGGCVAKSDYLKKEAEANALTEQVVNLSKDERKVDPGEERSG